MLRYSPFSYGVVLVVVPRVDAEVIDFAIF